MTDHLECAILEGEKRRCAAMLANDAAALDEVLDARLMFHHSSGAVDDKSAYLAKMAGGRILYKAIRWDEEMVTGLDNDTALLTGKMVTEVSVEGVDKTLINRVLSVWHISGDAWRMVAFQSTPMAA